MKAAHELEPVFRGEAPGTTPVRAIVLTYNEELNLERCLASLEGWVAEIVVVDSGSTDATLDIARRHGARIVHHRFDTHVSQWAWALENLTNEGDWILALDADQRVSLELRDELVRFFVAAAETGTAVEGAYLNRRQIFRGRWIRHGGYYPKYLLKLFRAGSVRVDEGELVDHHFYMTGETTKLAGDLIEENRKEDDLTFWIEKHNRYARLLAREELRFLTRERSIVASPLGTPDQRVAWLKRVWSHLPLYLRPVLYFLYRYVLRLGFLDGSQGLVFHATQGLCYRLWVDAHVDELRRERNADASRAVAVRTRTEERP